MIYGIIDGLSDPALIESCKDTYQGKAPLPAVMKWAEATRPSLIRKMERDLLDGERINYSIASKGRGGKATVFVVLNEKFDELFFEVGGILSFIDWIDNFENHHQKAYAVIDRKIPHLDETQKVVKDILNHKDQLKTLDYTQEELSNLFTYAFTNKIVKSGRIDQFIDTLSKMAIGYHEKYEDQTLDIDPDTKQVLKMRVDKKTKVYPPNMDAMKFIMQDVLGFGKLNQNPQALDGSFKKLDSLIKDRMNAVNKHKQEGRHNLAEITKFETQEKNPKKQEIDPKYLDTTYVAVDNVGA